MALNMNAWAFASRFTVLNDISPSVRCSLECPLPYSTLLSDRLYKLWLVHPTSTIPLGCSLSTQKSRIFIASEVRSVTTKPRLRCYRVTKHLSCLRYVRMFPCVIVTNRMIYVFLEYVLLLRGL